MAKLNSLKDLFGDQLKVLYYTENKFLDIVEKAVEKVSSEELKNELNEQLKVAESQVKRLEEVFSKTDMEASEKKCTAMDGIIDEINEVMTEDADPAVTDAAIIAEIQKAIHFKIACYGTLKTYAGLLDYYVVAERMRETVTEEKNSDRKLTEIAENVNMEAVK